MKILVLGHSAIFRRRVRPALSALGLTDVEVASRSGGREGAVQDYDDYATALSRSGADLVYVTTVNAGHDDLALAALDGGRHVVVDKPAFVRPDTAERAADLAARKNLLLAEALVYADHPRLALARELFSGPGQAATRIMAVFSMPPLPPDNFRHRAGLGGGALFDLGPYAASPGRLFFGGEPEHVRCRALSRAGEVDTAFSVELDYGAGRCLSGLFGCDAGYANRLAILGPDAAIDLERAFTTTPDLVTALRGSSGGRPLETSVPGADSFALFFQRVLSSIDAHRQAALAEDLLADSRTLFRLRRAAGLIDPMGDRHV